MNDLTTIEARISPADLFERFLRLSIADGAASHRTLAVYRQGFASYLAWCQARGQDPATASYDHIQEYRRALAAKHKRSTVQLRLRAVRILYDAMQRWGRRSDNPAAGVRAPKDRTAQETKVLQKALTPDEAKRFFHSLPDNSSIPGARDRAMMLLAMFHGLRAEELRNATVDDFGPAYQHMTVRGKGSKQRLIALLPIVSDSIKVWVEMMGRFRFNLTPMFYRLDIPGSLPLSVRSIERIADYYLVKSGLKQAGRSVHALRHTFAVLAALGGAEREALARDMGHADIRTTDVYVRAAAALQKPAALAAWAAFEGGRMGQETQIGTGKGPDGKSVTYWSKPAPGGLSVVEARDEQGGRITHSDSIRGLEKAGYTVDKPEPNGPDTPGPVRTNGTPEPTDQAPEIPGDQGEPAGGVPTTEGDPEPEKEAAAAQ